MLQIDQTTVSESSPVYRVFDHFLCAANWKKDDPVDEQRFFEALGQVVRNPKFDPEMMRAYFNSKAVRSSSRNDRLHKLIEHYVSGARSIQGYLAHIQGMYP